MDFKSMLCNHVQEKGPIEVLDIGCNSWRSGNTVLPNLWNLSSQL